MGCDCEPSTGFASTGYALANPGVEYPVYQPQGGSAFTIRLEPGEYALEWFDAANSRVAEAGRLRTAGLWNAPWHPSPAMPCSTCAASQRPPPETAPGAAERPGRGGRQNEGRPRHARMD